MRPQQADSKGRVNLGLAYAGQLFQVTDLEEGRILLEKAAIIPERELWLYKDPKAKSIVEKGTKEAARGKIKKNAIDLERYDTISDV